MSILTCAIEGVEQGALDPATSVLAVVAATIAFVLLSAWGLNRAAFAWFRRGTTTETIAQAASRLLTPDFAGFESHYHAPPPQELCELYADRELIARTRFPIAFGTGDVAHYVERFLPMSESTMERSENWLGPLRFACAEDDFGNSFYLDLSQPEAETHPVFFMDHDGGNVEHVADSLTSFRRGTVRQGGADETHG